MWGRGNATADAMPCHWGRLKFGGRTMEVERSIGAELQNGGKHTSMSRTLLKYPTIQSTLVLRFAESNARGRVCSSSANIVMNGLDWGRRVSALKIEIRASSQSQAASDPFDETHQRFINLLRKTPSLRPIAAKKLWELTEELVKEEEELSVSLDADPFEKIRLGFLSFKQQHLLKKPDHYKKLAAGQSPKFMVIACSDSRVCPSVTLGFQPGEAFVVRNVANLVPPWKENGFPGTSAALEFAVLSLKVNHILVIGHSRCGGINALMSMPDEGMKSSDFIESWMVIAKSARLVTKSVAAKLTFEEQCSHCEKESVNQSLSNLLTFPWIKSLVSQEKLFLHGGYYDFVEGSFERWTLGSKLQKVEKLNQATIDNCQWY